MKEYVEGRIKIKRRTSAEKGQLTLGGIRKKEWFKHVHHKKMNRKPPSKNSKFRKLVIKNLNIFYLECKSPGRDVCCENYKESVSSAKSRKVCEIEKMKEIKEKSGQTQA